MALERVAAYCRALGLSDRRAAQAVARRVVDAVVAEHGGEDGRAWMRLAVERLRGEVDDWLDALSRAAGRERHLIGASLPLMLRGRPELFLRAEGLPEGWRRGVASRPVPPLPPSVKGDMPRQRFGKPPAILRPGFWFRIWRWVQHEQHPIERFMRNAEFGVRKK